MQIKKVAMFTDIHFGKHGNSDIHNQDCVDFIKWFIEDIKSKNITHIVFMGDWFENRSAINISTLDYSCDALSLLNKVGLPILFCVGNHDLYKRNSRDIHSARIFETYSNITVIDNIKVIDNCLFSPFLFHDEYTQLANYVNCRAWFGHFEFQGFYLTGYNTKLEHGPSHTHFKQVKKIFSGHFHKRQAADNVCYIGNTFPMDFGDLNDYERGYATYDLENDCVEFYDWNNAPSYNKIKISEILDGKWIPKEKTKVKCLIDMPLEYTEIQELRVSLIEQFNIRDFIIDQDVTTIDDLNDIEISDSDIGSIDELIVKQLTSIQDHVKDDIDAKLLVELYSGLKIETDGNE